jgi:hypothetical protein
MAKRYKKSNKAVLKQVSVYHGNEGGRHDPWSYTEYLVNGCVLHMGLGVWLETPDEKVHSYEINVPAKLNHWSKFDKKEQYQESILIKRFEKITGVTLADIDRQENRYEPESDYAMYGGM